MKDVFNSSLNRAKNDSKYFLKKNGWLLIAFHLRDSQNIPPFLIRIDLVLFIMLCIINTQYLLSINTVSSLDSSPFDKDSKPEKMPSSSSMSISKANQIRKFFKDYVPSISFSCRHQQGQLNLFQELHRYQVSSLYDWWISLRQGLRPEVFQGIWGTGLLHQ